MNKNLNLQDVILNQIRKDKIASTFILMNGYQFKGVVKGFDQLCCSSRLRGQAEHSL